MATIFRRKTQFERLAGSELDAWAKFPTSILTDVMQRMQVLGGGFNPVLRGVRMAGQARTVLAMVADSSVVHAAISIAEEGDVLLLNAGGYLDRACWGGIATRAAMMRGVRGLVIDGAIRDVEEIREYQFPVYCRGVVPGGPHKGHGGIIDDSIAIGGVAAHPGDIIVGDDDGVAVVPLRNRNIVRAAASELMEKEKKWTKMVVDGGSMAELLGIEIQEIE